MTLAGRAATGVKNRDEDVIPYLFCRENGMHIHIMDERGGE